MSRGADAAEGRQRRADAERNIDAIADAALRILTAGGGLTMASVARAAGVSRVTLYSHFPSLDAVLDAAVARALTQANESTSSVESDHDAAAEVLERLVRSQWKALAGYRNVFLAASKSMPPERLRQLHDPLFGRVRALVVRGQREGHFRTDLPRDWLVGVVYGLMHQAAAEVLAGRLPENRAGGVVAKTVLSALGKC